MSCAIHRTQREQIIERYLVHDSYRSIAEQLHLSYWSVRQSCRRYRDRGVAGLGTDYHRLSSLWSARSAQ